MPLSWEYLKTLGPINYKYTPTHTVVQKAEYKEFREKVLDSYPSLAAFIKAKCFKDDPSLPYKLRKNDFPYDLERGISHWVLWLNPDIYKTEVEVYALGRINLILKTLLDQPFLFYVNPVSKQSVKEIPHYHVYLREACPVGEFISRKQAIRKKSETIV